MSSEVARTTGILIAGGCVLVRTLVLSRSMLEQGRRRRTALEFCLMLAAVAVMVVLFFIWGGSK